MFEGLQKRWKVSAGRLFLILLTFTIGGSLTGYLGKMLMQLSSIENPVIYIIIYILLVTIIWPMMVIVVSIPFGQFVFFKSYLAKMGKRLKSTGRKTPSRSITNMKDPADTKHIAIFASGAGSNAQKIIDHFKNSDIVKVVMIVCNKSGAGVIGIAERENIPVLIIEKERFFRGDSYVSELKNAKTDLIVLAGFLWKIPAPLLEVFPKRIINIHPALLPKYGGKGMFGQFVHEAVINSGDEKSGITIHFVDEHYDNGDVIFQTTCDVMKEDNAETLAKRIHGLEHKHYPRVVEEIVRGLPPSLKATVTREV
ncbi:MAG: phosphoribosylglycinamide formyltransferase [Flavitalea sp.]